jgi:hypothetical protein
MFWLFDTNIKESYDFVQIFELDEQSIDLDTVYTLNSDLFPIIGSTNYNDIIEKNNIVPQIFNFCIKIIGSNISYTNLNLTTNHTVCFQMEQKFIKPSENKFIKPIFEFTYKTVEKSKIPDLLSKQYDFYYPNIKFELYQINLNLILIKEFNKTNNSKRNYIIAKKN